MRVFYYLMPSKTTNCMIKPESLFLDSLNDLRNTLNSQSSLYPYIRSTVVLRQLFLDGDKSLIGTVNRPHRLKLRFEVVAHDEQFKQGRRSWWAALAPIRFLPTKLLNTNQFLKHPVCAYGGHTYMVEDIIEYGSYIMGGIHFGKPNDKQVKFTEMQKDIPLYSQFETPLSIASLHAIIEITLKGLEPLEAVIKGHASTGGL